jgi:hypothetical protein
MGRGSARQEAARARSSCRRSTSPTRRRTSTGGDPNCAAGACCPQRPNAWGCSKGAGRRAGPERSNNSRGDIRPGAGGGSCASSDSQECSGSEACTCVEFSCGRKTGSRGCPSTDCRAGLSAECHRHDANPAGRCRTARHRAVTAPCGSSVHRDSTSTNRRCAPGSGGRRASCGTCCGTHRARRNGSRCPRRSRSACKGNSQLPATDSCAGSYGQNSRDVRRLWPSGLQG